MDTRLYFLELDNQTTEIISMENYQKKKPVATTKEANKHTVEEIRILNIKTLIKKLGRKCTHQQILNHLKEDGMTCTEREFFKAHKKVHKDLSFFGVNHE